MQDTIFGATYDVKRLQPGKLPHDSSTLAGNSGSAIVDVEHGRSVGLHFAGFHRKRNYGVPIRELARDPRVREHLDILDADGLDADPEVVHCWSIPDRGLRERPATVPTAGSGGSADPEVRLSSGAVTFTIPLEVQISLGPIQGRRRSR